MYARMGWFHARGWAGYLCAGGLVIYTRMSVYICAGGLGIYMGVGWLKLGKFYRFFAKKKLRSLQMWGVKGLSTV